MSFSDRYIYLQVLVVAGVLTGTCIMAGTCPVRSGDLWEDTCADPGVSFLAPGTCKTSPGQPADALVTCLSGDGP